MISRDVIVVELKELNWDKNQRRDTIRVIFDESKSTEETQVEKNVRRLTRSRCMYARLQDYDFFSR